MASRIVQFGTFQADLESGELYRDGIKLKLGGQPFQVLEYLLSRPGEVVTREQLRVSVWQSDTFVDFDHGLNTAINKIREALGDSAANPRFVETIPRRGYRFIAPVDRPTTAVIEPEPAPPSPQPPAKATPRKWIGLAGGAAGAALAAWLVLSRSAPPTTPINYKLTQVTRDSGLTWQPSISGDGNFVAYASDRATGKDLDIWIQHVSGGQPVRLTSTSARESYPSLSADGRRVAFQSPGGIYVVPSLGGTPRLVSPAGQYPQISPDGGSVAFSSGRWGQASEVRVVSAEGGDARPLAVGAWAMAPLWTSNGRNLLAWGPNDYWMSAISGGAPVNTRASERLRAIGVIPMMHQPFSQDPTPVAAAATGGVVIAARSGDGHDLWFCPFSEGQSAAPPVRITVGAGAAHPSVAAAKGRIAFSRLAVNSGLWILPIETSSGRVTGEMRRMWTENVTVGYPSVSAEGKTLAYVSNRGGDPDVWIRDLETGADRQLTASKSQEFRAMLSPDGGRVAFGIKGRLYTMPSSGGVAKPVPNFTAPANVAGWSPDGRKLLCYHGKPVRHATVEVETGRTQDVVWHPTADIHNGRISPDGRWIMFTVLAEGTRVVHVASLGKGEGGKPESWIRVSGEGQPQSSFWSRDGNLVYIQQGDALWGRKLRPDTKTPIGDPFLIQRFNGPRFSPSFSADGLTKDALYFTIEETTSNIWIADPEAR